jgi:hypothetical protein
LLERWSYLNTREFFVVVKPTMLVIEAMSNEQTFKPQHPMVKGHMLRWFEALAVLVGNAG